MDNTQTSYDPNELVTLTNKKTNEVKRIPRSQLSNYGLSPTYTSQADIYAKAVSEGRQEITTVPESFRGGAIAALNDTNYKKGKSTVADTATNVLKVLDQHAKGQLTGKEFEDALNFAASEYNKRGFEEGGKQLTGPERALLSGTMINVASRVPTLTDKLKTQFTGYQVPTKSIVSDDLETIKNKMTKALETTGKKMPDMAPPAGGTVTPPNDNTQRRGDIVGNAINDVVDMGKGIIGLGGAAVQRAKDNFSGNLPANQGEIDQQNAGKMVGAVAKDIGNTVGISADQQGKFHFDPMLAVNHAYNHPVDTALTLIPLFNTVKGLGITGKAANAAKVTAESAAVTTGGGIKSRILTGIAKTDPESVTKSEELMQQALRITKSATVRGSAKELEDFVPKATSYIDEYAKKLDSVIGDQPIGDIQSGLKESLLNTTAGKLRPDLVDQVVTDFSNTAEKSKILPGSEPGVVDLSGMNTARKYFNKDLGSWFKNGRPLTSDADLLNSLQWQSSVYLKEIMAQADDTGLFKQILDLQHGAIQTQPVMAKAALSGTTSHGLTGFLQNMLRGVTSPVRVVTGRAMSGGQPPVVKNILTGQMPDIAAPEAAGSAQMAPNIKWTPETPLPEFAPIEQPNALHLVNPTGKKISNPIPESFDKQIAIENAQKAPITAPTELSKLQNEASNIQKQIEAVNQGNYRLQPILPQMQKRLAEIQQQIQKLTGGQ